MSEESPQEFMQRAVHGRDTSQENNQRIKQEVAAQYIGFAEIKRGIYDLLKKRPDIEPQEFSDLIAVKMQEFKPSPEQIEKADRLVETFLVLHNKISELRTRYPEDSELFKALWGAAPKGKVRIYTGPFYFYIKCDNDIDRARASFGITDPDREVTSDDARYLGNEGGRVCDKTLIPELAHFVTVQDSGFLPFMRSDVNPEDKIFRHEERHMIRNLFDKAQESQVENSYDRWIRVINTFQQDIKNANTDQIKKKLIKDFASNQRGYGAEGLLQSETIAFLEEGLTPWQIAVKMKTPELIGGYKELSNRYERHMKQTMRDSVGKDFSSTYIPILKEVYGRELNNVINSSMQGLSDLRKAGFTNQQIADILEFEPFNKWGKIARRILEGIPT